MVSRLKEIFSLNGPFIAFFEKLFWVIVANLLFFVSCIPVVSIGGSIKALNAVTNRLTEEKAGDFMKTYLNALFGKFLTSMLLTLTMLPLILICYLDTRFFFDVGMQLLYIPFVVIVLADIFIIAMIIAVFQILSREDVTYKRAIKEGYYLLKFYPKKAIGAVFSTVVTFTLMFLIINFSDFYVFSYLIFMLIGIDSLIISYIYRPVLTEPDEDIEENL